MQRIVVLVSGSGSTLQALLDAVGDCEYPACIAAVGADRYDTEGVRRAQRQGVPTFVVPAAEYADRQEWDAELRQQVAASSPDLVVMAGFMRLVSSEFLERFPGRVVNTHPALSPAFPGMNGPADALQYGVKITGATLFFVDEGVDTGPIIAQTPVSVRDDDTVDSLRGRIKDAERIMVVDAIARLLQRGWTISGRTVIVR